MQSHVSTVEPAVEPSPAPGPVGQPLGICQICGARRRPDNARELFRL